MAKNAMMKYLRL